MKENKRLLQLLRFLEHDPNDPFLQYAIATEYLQSNKPEIALFYYENLINNHENYVGTYYHLGKLYEMLNRKEDAAKTYQNGMHVARSAHNMHAFSELQSAYNAVAGLNYEDD